MSKAKPVHLRLHTDTIERIARIKQQARLPSKADTVRYCAEIALMVTDALLQGGKVSIEGKDGSVDRIMVPLLVPARGRRS